MKNKDLYQSLLYLRRHAQEALENFTMMEMGIQAEQMVELNIKAVGREATTALELLKPTGEKEKGATS